MAPPLILVAGLGGTCSEAAVSIFDGLEAFCTTSAARVLHDDIDGTHAHLRSDYVRVLYSNLSYSIILI